MLLSCTFQVGLNSVCNAEYKQRNITQHLLPYSFSHTVQYLARKVWFIDCFFYSKWAQVPMKTSNKISTSNMYWYFYYLMHKNLKIPKWAKWTKCTSNYFSMFCIVFPPVVDLNSQS